MDSSPWILLLIIACSVKDCFGHGRLVEPPSRSSMWRFGYNTPVNYDDNELSCGGYRALWQKHKGKCGVCGDEWDAPRDNEGGGKYAKGIITRRYKPGQTIMAKAEITAYHGGWMEFRLCENNNVKRAARESCFRKHLLHIHESYGTRYHLLPGDDVGMYTFHLRLPPDVTCAQCILRWRYHSGNSWGYTSDGRGCMGCGNQEEFYGCSDIAIYDNLPVKAVTRYPEYSAEIQVVNQQRDSSDESNERWYTVPDLDIDNGETPTKDPDYSYKYIDHSDAILENDVKDTRDPEFANCHAVGFWEGDKTIDTWCYDNCGTGYCPATFCKC